MTIMTEGKNSIYLTAPALFVDTEKDTAAWASKYIVNNPNIKWIIGNYVESDNANSNGQYWEYNDLRMSQPTINHSPMNIDHHAHDIVGTWVASEMMLPTDNSNIINPYIETLGAFWKYYFPEKLRQVENAYESGQLFISMECVSDSITCVGENGCGASFAYAGPVSDTYCSHIQERSSHRQLNQSKFLGGALIMPGNRPGWKAAEVKELSALTTDEQKDIILREIAKSSPHLNNIEIENTMWAIQMQSIQNEMEKDMSAEWAQKMQLIQMKDIARQFNTARRMKLAKEGMALPDGSFPIVNVSDLKNAIKAIGLAKDPAMAKAHIKKRAAALGASKLIPANW